METPQIEGVRATNMSPSTDRGRTTNRDTSNRTYMGHEMSPNTNRYMTTSKDTSGVGVRAMI
jgi:hypothetical protein